MYSYTKINHMYHRKRHNVTIQICIYIFFLIRPNGKRQIFKNEHIMIIIIIDYTRGLRVSFFSLAKSHTNT